MLRPLEDLPILHDKVYMLEETDVLQRIATDRDEVGREVFLHCAEGFFFAQEGGGIRSGGFYRFHGGEARFFYIVFQLAGFIDIPRETADFGAHDDGDTCF